MGAAVAGGGVGAGAGVAGANTSDGETKMAEEKEAAETKDAAAAAAITSTEHMSLSLPLLETIEIIGCAVRPAVVGAALAYRLCAGGGGSADSAGDDVRVPPMAPQQRRERCRLRLRSATFDQGWHHVRGAGAEVGSDEDLLKLVATWTGLRHLALRRFNGISRVLTAIPAMPAMPAMPAKQCEGDWSMLRSLSLYSPRDVSWETMTALAARCPELQALTLGDSDIEGIGSVVANGRSSSSSATGSSSSANSNGRDMNMDGAGGGKRDSSSGSGKAQKALSSSFARRHIEEAMRKSGVTVDLNVALSTGQSVGQMLGGGSGGSIGGGGGGGGGGGKKSKKGKKGKKGGAGKRGKRGGGGGGSYDDDGLSSDDDGREGGTFIHDGGRRREGTHVLPANNETIAAVIVALRHETAMLTKSAARRWVYPLTLSPELSRCKQQRKFLRLLIIRLGLVEAKNGKGGKEVKDELEGESAEMKEVKGTAEAHVRENTGKGKKKKKKAVEGGTGNNASANGGSKPASKLETIMLRVPSTDGDGEGGGGGGGKGGGTTHRRAACPPDTAFGPLIFPYLEKLSLVACPQLAFIHLEAPALREMETTACVSLRWVRLPCSPGKFDAFEEVKQW